MFQGPFDESIVKRAQEQGLVEIEIHNIRDCGLGKHKVVDDYPYGGREGMVMKVEPIFESVEAVKRGIPNEITKSVTILLTPQGRVLSQKIVEELATFEHLLLICGHYEGIDERVREHLVDDEISIGDYVLSGGELPAMVLVDSIVRRIPEVLGSEIEEDSHLKGLLEYPQYTRPQEYRGWTVPEVLLSGNHAEIAKWRHKQSLLRTLSRRPDILKEEDEH
jgi:tRNA (guanine37-N1)-methyltransferase